MTRRRPALVAAALLSGAHLLGAWPTAAAPPVRIGLFLPAGGEAGTSASAIERAARLAVDETNAAGGGRAARVELVVRQSDLPWAAGVGELVSFAYADDTAAVIGALDGRAAHFAGQVVTRTAGRVVLVTFATDATLTEIRLPWVFRVVPDDRAQAEALRRQAATWPGTARLATLVEAGDYDAAAMADRLERATTPAPRRITFSDTLEGRRTAGAALARGRFDGAVLLGRPGAAGRLAAHLSGSASGPRLLGPSRLACAEFLAAAGPAAEGTVIVAPAVAEDGGVPTVRTRFLTRYRQAHGEDAPPLAASAYDAVHAVAAAVRRIGVRADGLAATFAATNRAGASGRLRFDRSGNRLGTPSLLVVRRGALRPLP